jgi:hypothetical protein
VFNPLSAANADASQIASRKQWMDKSLWDRNVASDPSRIVVNADWAKNAMKGEVAPVQPGDRCSFCNASLEGVTTTREKQSRTFRTWDAEMLPTKEIIINEKYISTVREVKACPDCCLKVKKPIVARVV